MYIYGVEGGREGGVHILSPRTGGKRTRDSEKTILGEAQHHENKCAIRN